MIKVQTGWALRSGADLVSQPIFRSAQQASAAWPEELDLLDMVRNRVVGNDQPTPALQSE